MEANAVTYIGIVQDHSGSMDFGGRSELALSNFNEQRATLLKEDDETMDNLVTIVEFDDQIHCNVENMPISEVKKMKNWWCGGMTALFDAIAFCINNIKEKMSKDKRENKAALIIVQTDGLENKSTDYAGEKGRLAINKMINELEDTGIWSFVFLGENIDKEVAIEMGFKDQNTMSCDSLGMAAAYNCNSRGLKSYMGVRKAGGTQTMSFYNADDSTAKKPDNSWAVNSSGENDNNN